MQCFCLHSILMESAFARRRRKNYLKAKPAPELYSNSQLCKPVLQPRLQRSRVLQNSSSEHFPPPRRPARVAFTPSPSEPLFSALCLSPDKSSQNSKVNTSFSANRQSLRPILKRPESALSVKIEPRLMSTSASPVKSADYAAKPRVNQTSAFDDIDRMVHNLSSIHLQGLRGILAKCRAKTRAFYQEMHRQACMNEEEIRKEREHEAYFQRVLHERRLKVSTHSHKSIQARY